MGCSKGTVTDAIKWLEASEEPEMKKLLAKRKAYKGGGSQLVKILKNSPGARYQKITMELREDSAKETVRPLDTAELLRGLIKYCKECKDEELREILLKHKKAGGWMP